MTKPLSWVEIVLAAAENESARCISNTIEFVAEWRLVCLSTSVIDWTGFDSACRHHDGPWARRWLQTASSDTDRG